MQFFEWMEYTEDLTFGHCEGNNGRIYECVVLGQYCEQYDNNDCGNYAWGTKIRPLAKYERSKENLNKSIYFEMLKW